MSTETMSENKTTTIDNRALFGPLGKYAITGVIMGSIIVTTAIMLDRQSSTAEEHIAAIEKEILQLNASTSSASESENNPVQESIEAASVEATPVKAEPAAVQTAEAVAIDTAQVQVAEQHAAKVTTDTAETPVFDKSQTTEQIPATAQAAAIQPPQSEPADNSNNSTAETFMPQLAVDIRHPVDILDQEWQARIQTRELEYKQHLAEYFNDIKSRDSERLEQFKQHQDEHIDFLRDQIARQEQLIDELISRNKESYKMREARIQRQQISREQMLNRI
ncbi:MAG: hypothetical protein LJE83_11690 [Gammaproteobacteria bacterium]|nr:hypothetical protein [Gammaproteobacteria bacterium]